VLIGGAEDKKRDMVVLRAMLAKTKAKNIVVVPSASYYPTDAANAYKDAFFQLGAQSVLAFDIRNRGEADQEHYLRELEQADLVFFSGGDQVRLVEIFAGTALLERMFKRFEAGELALAGTSAGAAAVSDQMIFDGDYKGYVKGSVGMGKGFGLLPGITVDTHFSVRRRVARLSQFLAAGHNRLGIGLDEDTGIILTSDMRFKVIGSGVATVLAMAEDSYTDYHVARPHEELLEEGQKTFTVNNLRYGFLAPGTRFDLRSWSVLESEHAHLAEGGGPERPKTHPSA